MSGSCAHTRRDVVTVGVPALLVLVAAVVVASRGADPAAATTRLRSVVDAVAHAADGSLLPVTDGSPLPRGARLDTGRAGSAELRTAGRTVYVGARSSVLVLDGVSEALGRGQVLVDARSGPRLALRTEAGTVAAPAGSLTRVERGPLLRVGVYTGSAAVTADGRQATGLVPALHQVQVPYGGLPQRSTPLALTDGDRWERTLVRDLVTADRDLTELAAGLAGPDGSVVLSAAPAAYRRVLSPAVTRGEQALGLALGAAATLGGSTPQERIATVRSDRDAGGSWGVVAALVGAPVGAVSRLLDGLLGPAAGAGSATAAGSSGPLPLEVLLGRSAGPGPASAPRPGTGSGPGPRPLSGTRPPGPTPSPNPTTAPPAVVQGVVDTVIAVLPVSPTPGAPVSTTSGAGGLLPPPTVSVPPLLP